MMTVCNEPATIKGFVFVAPPCYSNGRSLDQMANVAYFELCTASDMLEKARREHTRLVAHFDIDNVFNFFVTAWHIQDYILKTKAVPQSIVATFLLDSDIQLTHDLCDKGKHLRLTKRSDPSTEMHFGNAIAGMMVAGEAIAGSGGKWALRTDNGVVLVDELAQRVLAKWDCFFAEYKL